MIVTRSPLRISLGGGGTDLPSYYKKYGGFLIAAAINKYVYISIAETFNKKFILKYSSLEEVKKINDIHHPLFRETLKKMNIKTPLNISSHADIPSGTGLGSSGSFTVSLVSALAYLKNVKIKKNVLAETACDIEIRKLNEPVGKQDQYVATYGGLNSYNFQKNNKVLVKKIDISRDKLLKLNKNLTIFFSGYSRSSYTILKKQNIETKKINKSMIDNLHQIKEFGILSLKYIQNNNFREFGKLMHEHWMYKKKRSKFITNNKIDTYYDYGIKNGALGGKLIGAGGGGFLMFYTEDPAFLENRFSKIGLKKLDYQFDFEGSKLIAK